MSNILSLGVYLVVGYLVGAMFSDHIFIDLTLTHWHLAWPYLWILLWPLMLVFAFWAWVLVIAVIFFICYGGYRLLGG